MDRLIFYLQLGAILLAFVVYYFRWVFKYWERKGIPYLQPSFPLGTIGDYFRKDIHLGVLIKQQYEDAKAKGYKHVGLFNSIIPAYMPLESGIIKNILTRDFDHFMSHGVYYNEKDDPLSGHLFLAEEAKWRNLRVKLTPAFTSGKMKMMFQMVVECSNQMRAVVDELVSKGAPVDIKDTLSRFTINTVSSCGFGFDHNCFIDKNSKFLELGTRYFHYTTLERLKLLFAYSCPNFARKLGISTTPKESADFFMKVISDAFEYRKTHNFVRKDFIQVLIDLHNSSDGKDLSMEVLAAQALLFLVGGYETSSTTMSFCLFELAQNQSIQSKLRCEINNVLDGYNGRVTYEAINEMKYLKQVIEETLRKYPPLPLLPRKCTKTYTMPGTGVIMEKGTQVVIPLLGLHYDPDYYTDPEQFDPERFSEGHRNDIEPFTYMPFGEGPRYCIGKRFGMMQTKVGLVALLKDYRVKLSTATDLPLKFDLCSYMLMLKDQWLWLTFEETESWLKN